jgi:CRP-like cAMP-binding protein
MTTYSASLSATSANVAASPQQTSAALRPPGNLILAFLPPNEMNRLSSKLQPVELAQGQILYDARMPVDHVYFMDQGMISVVSVMRNGDTIEVGTVGIEGMAGMSVMLGVEAVPYRHIVQVAGRARRMSSSTFAAELPVNLTLRTILNRYHAAFNTQVMQGMACNGLHSVIQRCCRWLLTTQDRLGSQELNITHEFLAQMLGVRRASVTEVLRPLQNDGLIRASRGKVVILDSKRLADASCECYGVIRSEYQRLLG